MYPWLWVWAPHLQFPLSGNVSQEIEPVANLFSGRPNADAGNPAIEQQAFDVASYGKQLGLITEVLIELAERSLPDKGRSNESLGRLKRIQAEIEKIKDIEYQAEAQNLERTIKAIRRRGGKRSTALLAQLRALPSPTDA